MNLFCEKREDKQQFLERLKEDNQEFHTYTDKEDKTHAFVLRGLDSEPTVNELKDALTKEHSLPIKQIYSMRTKYRPLYLVVTTAAVTLKEIQSQVRFVLHTKIKWERHENRRIITQCHRCQNWGHATSNCFRTPRCVKCAAEYLTRDCTKQKEEEPVCCNCSANHPANFRQCPVYIRKLDEVMKRNPRLAHQQQQTRDLPETFVPAPPPKENAWSNRAQQPAYSASGARFPPLPPPLRRRAQQRAQQGEQQEIQQGEQQEARLKEQQRAQQSLRPLSGLNPPLNTATKDLHINTNIFTELSNEISELNTLVNLENLLQFVKDFNSTLRAFPDKRSRSVAAFNFISNITEYDI